MNRLILLISLSLAIIMLGILVGAKMPLYGELSQDEKYMLQRTVDLKAIIPHHPRGGVPTKEARNIFRENVKIILPSSLPSTPSSSPTLTSTPTPLSLTFVIMLEGKRSAMINNRFLKEGDTIEGYTVGKIEPNRVLLKGLEERWIYIR